ncbi:hypothetical protein H5410_015698 [Solanum commersonii]|uniref:Zinc finger PMZ-type domain-containing protein n=1 Tax=Solanum commersonii TaxID=4109 RepID=A0A9J5ZV65_SOLCO|nr:hypothetical protein H5410_015698 [Solanum commersonii]
MISQWMLKNARHASLYMMDIAADVSRPIIRINVIARSPFEPTNSFNDNNSIENENLGDQPKESFCDHSNDNMGDYSMKMYDHSVDVEDQPVDAEDFKHFEEVQEKQELRLQPNHSFSDETNFYMYQIFSTKSELQLEYDLVKIPCAHAMVALSSKRGDEYDMNIYEYYSPLYKAKTYLLAYSKSINIVPIESESCLLEELLSVNILPPLVDSKLGRKKRKLVKGVSENFKSKRTNKCSICKRSEHKRTGCMNNNKS